MSRHARPSVKSKRPRGGVEPTNFWPQLVVGGQDPRDALGDVERVLVETVAPVQLERTDDPGAQLHVVVVGLDAATYAVDHGFEIAQLAHIGTGPAERERLVPSRGRLLLLRRLADHVGARERRFPAVAQRAGT